MYRVDNTQIQKRPVRSVVEGQTMQMAKYGIQRTEILARLTPLNTG